jgi:hypothetical protein
MSYDADDNDVIMASIVPYNQSESQLTIGIYTYMYEWIYFSIYIYMIIHVYIYIHAYLYNMYTKNVLWCGW